MTQADLRQATSADRAGLLDLWVEAWSAALPDIDFSARRGWFATHLDNLARDGAVTILAVAPDAALRGFVTCNPATHYLDQLAVRPAERGGGLAGRLMAEARRLSPNRLELDVNQNNPRAVRFYTREGFRIVSQGRNPNSNLAIWHMVWQR